MTAITQFDKAKANAFHKALAAAHQKIAAEFGLTVEPSRATFNENSFRVKVEFKSAAAPSKSDETLATLKRELAFLYGEDKVDGILALKIQGMRIVGYRSRAPKKPWILQDAAGKQYVGSDGLVTPTLKLNGFKSIFDR